MASDYLNQLVNFVTCTRLEDLDDSTITAAKSVVLDTLGAVLAGSRLEENAGLAQLARDLSGPGKATILGHPGQVQPVFATLVNATAGVSLEMDEGNRLGGGHPSIHVTPAAIAVGEELGRSGREVLESIIVSYEVTSRVGSGTRVSPKIHSHGTWGTIGAAAATARLLKFDAAHTRRAMNLAMSMSPANTWTPCFEGATVRNLYPGRSGFQGIMATYLCRCGFTAVNDGPSDLYQGVLGGDFDPEIVVQGLGAGGKLRIQQNYFKLHACCLYNHPVLDAMQKIMRRHPFTASEVSRMQVAVPTIAMTMADPEPGNMLAAKFSIPFALSAAIVHGSTDVAAFYPERVADPAVRELARRIELAPDPQMDLRRYDYPAGRVAVTLQDGRVLTESVTAHHGDAPDPASREELLGKFKALAQDTLGRPRTRAVIDTVDRLDQLANIQELTRLLGDDQ